MTSRLSRLLTIDGGPESVVTAIDPLQPDGVDGEEIDREDASRVRAKELAPRRTAARPRRSEMCGPKQLSRGSRWRAFKIKSAFRSPSRPLYAAR